MSITSVSPANHTIVDPTGSGVTLSWTTQYTQTHYQVIYRRVGASTWVNSGKVASTTRSHTIPGSALVKNAYYEWRVRYWYGTSGQSPWTASNIFKAQVPSIGRIRVSGGGTKTVDLRVVPLGKSELPSNVRVRLSSGTGELDLVPTGSPIESGVRVAVKAGVVRGVAKPMPDQYTNYANHSNTGYNRYDNHTDTGYDDYYSVYSKSGYSKYSDHTNYTETYYSNHTDSYSNFYSNHTNSGYSRYSNHSDSYTDHPDSGTSYEKYTDSGYRAYDNHSDYGYDRYRRYTESGSYGYNKYAQGGYSAYSNHTDTTTSTGYNNHSDSGYDAYSNHSDKH